MKTRRNHRHKTTTSMRRRRNTRIYRRKGTTVSSGRRRHFFKRGGAKLHEIIEPILKVIEPSVKPVIGDITLTTDNVYDKPDNTFDTPIKMVVNDTEIMFVNVKPTSKSIKQSVYIYVYNPKTIKYELKKKIMITRGNDHMGSYFPDVASTIFNALKQYKP
jgi:hypothetical protein